MSISSQPSPPASSSKLGTAKILGGVGSIMMLLVIAPHVGIALFIVGLVLVFISLKYIADEVKDQKIFNYALAALIISIIGIIALVFLMILIGLSLFGIFSITGYTEIIEKISGGPIGHITITPSYPPTPVPKAPLVILIILVITVLIEWGLTIASAYFIRNSYNLVAKYTGVGLFSTSGLLYLIGAGLIILFGIGFILILIGLILQIIAFFSLPEKIQPQAIMA